MKNIFKKFLLLGSMFFVFGVSVASATALPMDEYSSRDITPVIEMFGRFLGVAIIIIVIVIIVLLVSNWKIYQKAGRPGWNSIVPIYNYYVQLKYILNRPPWLLILIFVPYVNYAVYIWMSVLMAKRFGKDWIFAIGMIFLPFIFLPILAFGDAKFTPEQGAPHDNSPIKDFSNSETKKEEPEIEVVEEIIDVEVKDESTESEPKKSE